MRSFGAHFLFWVIKVQIYRVAFIGHRKIDDVRYIEDRIEELAFDLLHRYEFVDFYMGRNGHSDSTVTLQVY